MTKSTWLTELPGEWPILTNEVHCPKCKAYPGRTCQNAKHHYCKERVELRNKINNIKHKLDKV